MKNPKTRKILFQLIALLLPLIFIIIFELFLRIFNFFPQTPLFFNKSKDGLAIMEINANVGERYFNKKKIPVPKLYPQTFSVTKNKNTLRLFCLGGSTTAGFPYEMTVPFPQQLYFLLKNDYPDKNFEVVNMGLSAINSFTILDWLPDILEQEPDLIIIYMGHNEFYGAYGAGSAISFGNNGSFVRFIMDMQKFHLVQMLKTWIYFFTPDESSKQISTLMEKVIENRFIPVNSAIRGITNENFSENLDLILNACHENGVPVILSNLVSNLKDQPPLGTDTLSNSDSTSASFFYNKGKEEFNKRDSVKAKTYFLKALNYDAIPFRATQQINSIILDKALKYKVNVLDMYKVFEEKSPSGIPGDNLFCDHLHPTPEGYRLMANQFYKLVMNYDFLPLGEQKEFDSVVPSFVTALDWEIGLVRIFKLKQHWPFSDVEVDFSEYVAFENETSARIAKDFLFEHHIWGKAHSDMAEFYMKSGEFEKTLDEYRAIISMYPDKINYHLKLINLAKQLSLWDYVKSSSKKALNLTSINGQLYLDLAIAEYKTGDTKHAIENIQKAINSPELKRDQLADAYFYFASLLIDIKKYSEAQKMLEALLKEVPNFNDAKQLLKQIETNK